MAAARSGRPVPKASIYLSVVSCFLRPPNAASPVDLAGARRAAIVLRHCTWIASPEHERMAWAWSFSSIWAWKVSYIVFGGRVIDYPHQSDGLRRGRNQVDLEAVEVLDRQHDPPLGDLGRPPKGLDAVLDLVRGGPGAGDSPMAEWNGPQRISQPNCCPHSIARSRCSTAASRTLESEEMGLRLGPITVTGSSAFSPWPSTRLPSRWVRCQVARGEDRDLHRVEPERLDLVEEPELLGLGDMVGPEEKVHAGFHVVLLTSELVVLIKDSR